MIDKFKDIFYDGASEDPEVGEKPKRVGAGAGRGRGRGANSGSAGASQASSVGKGRGRGGGKKRNVEVVGQFIAESDSEED